MKVWFTSSMFLLVSSSLPRISSLSSFWASMALSFVSRTGIDNKLDLTSSPTFYFKFLSDFLDLICRSPPPAPSCPRQSSRPCRPHRSSARWWYLPAPPWFRQPAIQEKEEKKEEQIYYLYLIFSKIQIIKKQYFCLSTFLWKWKETVSNVPNYCSKWKCVQLLMALQQEPFGPLTSSSNGVSFTLPSSFSMSSSGLGGGGGLGMLVLSGVGIGGYFQ